MIEVLKQAYQLLLTEPHAPTVCDQLEVIFRQAIAELESQEPVAWVDLQKEAQQIVESKILWKRFIDGTPLANDIACWMADFALQHTHPPQRTWVGLTDEQVEKIIKANMSFQMNLAGIRQDFEAAYGIKE
jgi:hypothetical protein